MILFENTSMVRSKGFWERFFKCTEVRTVFLMGEGRPTGCPIQRRVVDRAGMKFTYVEEGELEDGFYTLLIGYCVYLCVLQANVAMWMN